MTRTPRATLLISFGLGILLGLALMTATLVFGNLPIPKEQKPKPDVMTAGQLAGYCRAAGEPSLEWFCNGFVDGALNARPDVGPCLPHDWNVKEATNQFLAWFDLHPERREYPAGLEVIEAQPTELRCRKGGKNI